MSEQPKITTEIHYSRIKQTRSFQHLVKTDSGEWKIRIDKVFEGFDSLLQKWVKLNVETSYEPLETTWGLKKSLEFDVLFQRQAINDNLQTIRAYFVQKIKCEIPDLKMFKDVYVSLENGNLLINSLPDQCLTISLNFSEDNVYGEFLTKVGEPRKLTIKEATEMINRKDVLSLFEEDRDGNFANRIISNIRVSMRG